MKKLLKTLSEKYPTLFEIIRFLIVGGFATIIDMLTMGLILYFANPSLYNHNFIEVLFGNASSSTLVSIIATGSGFLMGLLFNYIFSILFVFATSNTNFAKTKKGFISFFLLSFVGFLIHTIGMWIGHGLFDINEWIIKITLTFIVLIFNYITRKKIIFKD